MKILEKTRCKLGVFLFIFIMFGILLPTKLFADISQDISGHWAEEVIQDWIAEELVTGYPDGTIRPNDDVTRAEFMTMINKAFGFESKEDIHFPDVSEEAWFYDAVRIAVNQGYIGGYSDGTIKPLDPISRQEVAVILANIFSLAEDISYASSFIDVSTIPEWSKGFVGSVVKAGFMSGYPDDSFRPVNTISRAEAIQSIQNARIKHTLISEDGIYGPKQGIKTLAGDLNIKAESTVLQNYNIKGNLIISEEVGNGDVTLNNITVEGTTYIRGGGADSVYINGGKFNSIIFQKPSTGAVRLVANDVNDLQVVVAEEVNNQQVRLEGNFEMVTIDSNSATIEVKNSSIIEEIAITEKAEKVSINLSSNSMIEKAIINSSGLSVDGEGSVQSIEGTQKENVNFGASVKTPENATNTNTSSSRRSPPPSPSKVELTDIAQIEGTLEVGSELVAGSVTPTGSTVSYQWLISETEDGTYEEISGANSNNYTPVEDDLGKYLMVVATGTGDYTGSVTSAVIGPVATPAKYFEFNEGVITGYDIDGGLDVVIPSKINGVNVTEISEQAFMRKRLNSVIIPDSVTSIGQRAFSSNSLASISIPDDVTNIGESAFSGNQLKSVIIPCGVTNIGNRTFASNNLKSIVIPENVSSIGDRAFIGNKIKSITIPDSVISIGNGAFAGNGLSVSDINLGAGITDYWIYNPNDTQELIGHIAGGNNGELVIPEGVISISDGAFENSYLNSVIVPNTVENIGDRAFRNNLIDEIYLPDSVTSIGDWAFTYNSINSVSIPSNVNDIGMYTFMNNQLTSVDIPEGVTSIGDSAFSYNQLKSVDIPTSITHIGTRAFFHNQLTEIDVPENLTRIGEEVFASNNIKSVTIPDSVRSIDYRAFKDNQLASMVIPDRVRRIEGGAFAGNGLHETDVTLGAGVTDYWIYNYRDEQEVNGHILGGNNGVLEIPNGVTSISARAFENNSITNVSIPDTVTSIGEGAFSRNSIIDVILPANLTIIERNVFIDNKISSIYIPNGVTTIDEGALAYNELTTIELPKSLTQINTGALQGNQLRRITIGSNVTIEDNLLGGRNGNDFREIYETKSREAGTYIRLQSGIWEKQTGEIKVIEIPDANLEQVIRDELNMPRGDITENDMAIITSLSTSGLDISNLEGLQYAVNLNTLNISRNEIEDISVLSSLINLKNLYIWDNPISEIDVLTNLVNLERLEIRSDLIEDISTLENLSKLQELRLFGSYNDVSVLNNLIGLQELSLSSDELIDISPLSDLPELERLSLYGKNVTITSPLVGFEKLVHFSFEGSQSNIISLLKNLTSLKSINLWGNQIEYISNEDIKVLNNMPYIEQLNLGSNQIKDISNFSNAYLPNLKDLGLGENNISDISALSGLTSLERLRLGGNAIDDITALGYLNNLVDLSIERNRISDIYVIANFNDLEYLNIMSNEVSDITPLQNLNSLEYLSINDNRIADIKPFITSYKNSGLDNLVIINLMNNFLSLEGGSETLSDIQFLINQGIHIRYEPQKSFNTVESIVSVAIDNYAKARPQSGLNNADIVYETSVAPGITRYLALFDLDKQVEKIGPVRSAREHIVNIASSHKSALAHAGGSTGALNLIPSAPIMSFDEIYGSRRYFFRSDNNEAPYNLYTSTSRIIQGVEDRNTVLVSPDRYSTGENEDGINIEKISVKFLGQNFDTEFRYNGLNYERYEKDSPVLLEDGAIITADNVVVLYADHEKEYVESIDEWVINVNLIGSGPATFCRDGKAWSGEWQKTSMESDIEFTLNEDLYKFAPGNIWILIVPN
ncbi:Leucine-rich repeat (LRR) protein [Desulfitispora alkaliphila]|uniref:leucine-rich repeat protein n=1 Tax=Desulfitispora alkaliphila TaxID=622674 RepID=UPI003D1B1A42